MAVSSRVETWSHSWSSTETQQQQRVFSAGCIRPMTSSAGADNETSSRLVYFMSNVVESTLVRQTETA